MDGPTSTRQQQVLCDTKWQLFITRTWLFTYIPFVQAAFGAGSLAVGNVNENSDFDVLVLASSGHIFTARFFAVLAFSLFGWRRTKLDHRLSAKDKVCLNHFATPEAYRLTLRPNAYWKALYSELVPIYGSPAAVEEFFKANEDWLGKRNHLIDIRWCHQAPAPLKVFLERLLGGSAGSWFEQRIKQYQIGRIQQGLPKSRRIAEANRIIAYQSGSAAPAQTYNLPPLIKYSDIELEFHPDPATVEVY